MIRRLRGSLQSGSGKAAHWLSHFGDAYRRKTGMAIFPGSLNLALADAFDWYAAEYRPHLVWFGRDEFESKRDVLLLPCTLLSLAERPAMLWTTTTAARSRPDPRLIEIISDVGLRDLHGLSDGDRVELEIPVGPIAT